MTNWLDGVADQFLEGSKSLICGIYKASPTAALAKLAGNAGFEPAQALTNAWNSACGAPNALPASNRYGEAGKRYKVVASMPPANFGVASVLLINGPLGPIDTFKTLVDESATYFEGPYSTWTVQAIGTDGQGIYNLTGAYGAVPSFLVTEIGGPDIPPNPGAGYPPLTPQQNLDLQKVLDQLAAIRNTQGLQSAALAGLGATAAANLAATAGVAAAVAGVAAEVAAVASEIAAVLAAIASLRTLVQLIDTHLGGGSGTNADSAAWSSLSAGLDDVFDGFKDLYIRLGIGKNGFTLQTTPTVQLSSAAAAFSYLATHGTPAEPVDLSEILQLLNEVKEQIGFATPLSTTYDTSELSLYSVSLALGQVIKLIGYIEEVMIPGRPADATRLLTVSDTLQAIAEIPPQVVNIQGFEIKAPRFSVMQIYFNISATVISWKYLTTIPYPKSNLTAAQIRALAPARTPGDWNCTLRFRNQRAVRAWFASEAAGKAYLTTLAGLSTLPLDDEPNFTATHKPGGGPDVPAGSQIFPVRSQIIVEGETPAVRSPLDLRQ